MSSHDWRLDLEREQMEGLFVRPRLDSPSVAFWDVNHTYRLHELVFKVPRHVQKRVS